LTPQIIPQFSNAALAIILQAYLGISDDEVIEEMLMDQRWQLVLDCLNCETPPFSQPTLIRFRNRLIKKELDQRLIDSTVEIAKQKGGFGSSQLKAAWERVTFAISINTQKE